MRSLWRWIASRFGARRKPKISDEDVREARRPWGGGRPEPGVTPCVAEGCRSACAFDGEAVLVLAAGCKERVVAASGSPFCAPCLARFLSERSGRCAACGEPILPGSPVAANVTRFEGEFVHYTLSCSSPGAYVGTWGEGKLREA